MQKPLSKRLLQYYNCSEENEPELRKVLNDLLHDVCKPCWELKYCPYGSLVEEFPLPPCIKNDYIEHLEYIKKCLELGKYGSDFDRVLDKDRRKWFEEDVAHSEESINECVDALSFFEKEASCKQFGHLCPVYFVGELVTETDTTRNRSRNIQRSTLIRVVRRDNNTCQICGKTLLDKDIEIDHIIPFSRGGTSDERNLQVTCLECNRKKGRKYKE